MFFWFTILITFAANVFLFFDEEPLFDITDLNIIHVLLLVVCFWSIFWENSLRSKYGQYTHKDQSLLFSFLSYWFTLENYIYVIVIVFCFHCLTPLESELFELVEVYSCLLVWYTTFVLPYLVLVTFFYFFLFFINYNMNWLNKKFVIISIVFVFVALVMILFFMLFDLFFNSLTSFLFLPEFLNYNNSASTLAYGYNTNEFDWHKTKKGLFIVRFEDLYVYSVQLLNLVGLFSFIILFFFFIFDLLFLVGEDKTASFTFFGVILRFYENFLFKFFLSFLLLLLVSFRVTFKCLVEFNFFLF